MPAWAQRLLTRGVAVVPVIVIAWLAGESGAARLLILSQVVLSLQLPFAVIPLVRFTTDRARLGELAAPRWVAMLAWVVAGLIVVLNGKLVLDIVLG
jgi:manganese transport protein